MSAITDPLFFQLFQASPETFFLLLGLSPTEAAASAKAYEFRAVEVKETAHRLDGVFIPKNRREPFYFVDLSNDPVNAAKPPGRPPIIAVMRNRSAGVFVGKSRATFSVRIDCVCTSIYMAVRNHKRPTPVRPARKETHPLFPNQKPAANAPKTSVHHGRKYCNKRQRADVNKVCFRKLICRVIIGLWNIEIQIVAPEWW